MNVRKVPVLLSIVAALIVLALAGCGGGGKKAETTTTSPTTTPKRVAATPTTAPKQVAATPTTAPPISAEGGVRVVEVTNHDLAGSGAYRFDPKDFVFKIGETVTIRVTAESEFHTFNVDELGIALELNPGQTVGKTFTFNRAGTFKLYCIPHQDKGMVGTFTIRALGP